jgi:intraflagellar transport protein 52
LYLASEGGESTCETNLNYLFEEFGMSVNPDHVARSVYFKYFHPKEVLVTNGILNREINRAAGKSGNSKTNSLSFLYAYGASINVEKPAIPILSSGSVSLPLNRPIGAVCQISKSSGKLMCIGSAQMFSDQYIDKEENGKLFDTLIEYLTSDKIVLNPIDANEPDVDVFNLASRLPSSPRYRKALRETAFLFAG